jgi:hypothetical protein
MRRAALTVTGCALAAAHAMAQQPPAPTVPPAAPTAKGIAGPTGKCDLVVTPRSDSTRVNSVKQPSGVYNSFVGGGVTGNCPAQGLTLSADSAEYFGDLRRWHLIGAVHYREPRLSLDSDVATYFMQEERLLAEGNVHSILPSGTTLVGPRVEYFRAVPGFRAVARMIAPGRPTITIIEHDTTGKPSPPMVLIANTVVSDADSLVYASGRVEITREDVIARGDTAFLDGSHEFGRLMRKPSIVSRGQRAFTLFGTIIDLYGGQRQLHSVIARGEGKAVTENGTITSDTLDFEMADGGLARMYAWGPSRAHAVNPQYDILADSLDARSPGQRLREIRAIRKAYAQSMPDSTKFKSKERDYMKGDTILAKFDSLPVSKADSAKQPQLLALVAKGHASSYYKIAPRDSTAVGPAINYVRGGVVTVAFLNRAVQSVTVSDSVAGVYIEPTPPEKKKKKTDSSDVITAVPKKKTDSTAAKTPPKGTPPKAASPASPKP